MNVLIRDINKVMGNFMGSELTIRFFENSIVFGIYEQEIPIVVNAKDKTVCLDSETTTAHLTGDMLKELSDIVVLIEEKIDTVLSCLETDK